MIYFFQEDAGNPTVEIDGDNYTHIIKSRRSKTGDLITFRNFKDLFLYSYKILEIDRRKATLEFVDKKEEIKEASKKLHIGWSIVNIKTVEKNLPYLNELGVDKITFIYSSRSQKNFKINFERLEKILINSSCQCGRSSVTKLEICDSLEEFLKENPTAAVLDFSENFLSQDLEIDTIIIGPEGGFSKEDKEILKNQKTYGLNSPFVLRSETATTAVSSLLLL